MYNTTKTAAMALDLDGLLGKRLVENFNKEKFCSSKQEAIYGL